METALITRSEEKERRNFAGICIDHTCIRYGIVGNMRKRWHRYRSISSLLLITVIVSACGAASTVIPPHPASTKTRSVFADALAARHLMDIGPTAGTENIHLLISLAHRNEAQLEQLIHDQETPGSASYLHFLTPQQFDQQFGALPTTRDAIKSGLQHAGFTIDPDRFGASVIEADGPATRAEVLFNVQLRDVRESSGRVAHIPTKQPSTPSFLQQNVVSILGLDTTRIGSFSPSASGAQMVCPIEGCATPIPKPTPIIRLSPTPAPTPTAVPGSQYASVGPGQPLSPPPGYTDDTTYLSYGYAPYTYAYDYDVPVQHGFAGSSQFAIGILGDYDVSDSDLSLFYSDMNVYRTGHLYRVGSGSYSEDAREAAVDVETVSALAPGADVYLYLSPNLVANDMTAAMNTVVQQNVVAVLSISFAFCENQGPTGYYESASGMDNAAAQASAQGITVIAGSGDSGGPSYLSGCSSVMAPASSSYVLGVGGTSPDAPDNNQGAAGADAYRPGYQYAWGEPAPAADHPPCAPSFCGTGGGASTHFQTAEQLGACGGSGTTWKCVPDVSFAADIYHAGAGVFQGSLQQLMAGTSFAAPIFASIQAEIDQRQGTRKGNVVGRLYSLWRQYGYGSYTSGHPAIFQDMTAGNSGYAAAAGWDAASGIGSLDGFELSSVE
ncbi:MAG TPA: protease pro-enzyme activation domain-containing protein [Candidatus Baltobacteraceae bacterium]|nr:protease pro-enzyme activation domain-containing protein [Candidatus Baltobacteraceae bacterium]